MRFDTYSACSVLFDFLPFLEHLCLLFYISENMTVY